MSESLNVIALISGGKDSFFSILHCLKNGHNVIALGNLCPPAPKPHSGSISCLANENPQSAQQESEEEHDLNSFLYQTVGHTIIPLYAKVLELPLYRQQIIGSALQAGLSYYNPSASTTPSTPSTFPSVHSNNGLKDETESLVPLLRTIMSAHPSANALSTGAILSTYQRTRIESIALRLGLIPLSYLWQYTSLPSQMSGQPSQTMLLQDMAATGLEARIVKVASGGLDESFLWEDVVSNNGMKRVERAVGRFGDGADGAVLGEGGEFETVVLDGPAYLFKGRIVVEESERKVVTEGGGAAWLALGEANVIMKEEHDDVGDAGINLPDLLDGKFLQVLKLVWQEVEYEKTILLDSNISHATTKSQIQGSDLSASSNAMVISIFEGHSWTVVAQQQASSIDIQHEMEDILSQVQSCLKNRGLQVTDIIFTTIVLRHMADFSTVNKIYGALFTQPNPPSRVTVACGNVLQTGLNVMIHWKLSDDGIEHEKRKALHVQSRSYWAPANIGPYSQAQTEVLAQPEGMSPVSGVYIAGQIPLVPATMSLSSGKEISKISILLSDVVPYHDIPEGSDNDFALDLVLSMQHLWRIGVEMHVSWWTSSVAYLARDYLHHIRKKARLAGAAWKFMHLSNVSESEENDDEESRDLWEELHHGGLDNKKTIAASHFLPDLAIVKGGVSSTEEYDNCPPFFAVEVEELPRGASVEWHAHTGLTAGPLVVSGELIESYGTAQVCVVARHVKYTVIMLSYKEKMLDLADRVEKLLTALGNKEKTGYGEAYTSYIDANIEGLWTTTSCAGVVPCRSIWDQEGARLAAVLLFRTTLS